ncbi:helicase [Aureococcus anophagefferens]|nr:helicase [Aureococcus anophagefferens]
MVEWQNLMRAIVDREEAWQRKKAAEAAAKIRRAGRATDLIPAAVTLGATQIEEDHRHEQFFYDEPTSRRMLALVDGYETPLLLAAATRTLMGAAPRPLYVGYNAKRAAELEAAFAEFALKNTGEVLTYASGVMAGDITLFSNV